MWLTTATMWNTTHRSQRKPRWRPERINNKPDNDFDHMDTATCRDIEHSHFQSHSLTHRPHPFRHAVTFVCVKSVFPLQSLGNQIESSFVIGVQSFDIRAVDIHYVVRAYTPRRNPHTVHPSAHSFVWVVKTPTPILHEKTQSILQVHLEDDN